MSIIDPFVSIMSYNLFIKSLKKKTGKTQMIFFNPKDWKICFQEFNMYHSF